MPPVRKVLVPTDFSAGAEVALTYAIDVACRNGSEVHLLHIYTEYDGDLYGISDGRNAELLRKDVEAAVEARLQVLLESNQRPGVVLRAIKQRSLSTASTILSYACGEGVDLIVMGTHGRRGMRHLLLGSVAEEVVRKTECHVLTVRESAQAMPARLPYRRILVPVDFSEYAAPTVSRAAEIAVAHQAEMLLLHVVETKPLPVYWVGYGSLIDLVADVGVRARHHMGQLIEQLQPPYPLSISQHVQQGHVPSVIAEFAASQDADLIVIAHHAEDGLRQLLAGRTTERVIRSAASPVLSLHGLCPVSTATSYPPVPGTAAFDAAKPPS